MKQHDLSTADVERLLGELAQDDAQTELMRRAAHGEIRRVFRRRRLRRVAGELALVACLGSSFFLLRPEKGSTQAGAASPQTAVAAATPVLHKKKAEATPAAACGYDCHSETAEAVIYAVPL